MTASFPQWTGLAAALVESERYRPLQRLGKKAGRQTLLCEDRETGQRVVIKLLSFGEDFAWDDLKLFEREAETLRSLDHPAIPKYLDYFDLETPRTKGFALVQSHIEAQSLEQQLKAGRSFSEAEIQQIGEDLLNILEYLHGRQPPVIHRDIKPSNILLGDRSAHSPGQVYLVDFGSVQTLAAREGSTITVVGTYGYMPPEQFGGRAVPASDLYSLGATLIYLASGMHPADLPQKELRIQFEDKVQLTPQAIAWLQSFTEPSLDRRTTSAAQAHLSHSRPSSYSQSKFLAPRTDIGGNASVALGLKPSFSQIEARYLPTGELEIKLPSKQVSMSHVREPLVQKTVDDNDGCFAGIVIGIIAFIGLPTYGHLLRMPSFFWTVWLLVVLPCLIIWGPRWYLTLRPAWAILVMNKNMLQIRLPFKAAQQFNRNRAWRLLPAPQLWLSLGSHSLSFDGSSAELHWLERVFRDELELPAE